MTHARPPHFVLFAFGGTALATTAGYVNAVAVLSPLGLGVTHATGNATRLGIDAVGADGGVPLSLLVGCIGAFALGSAISGAVLDSSRLQLGRRYGVLLVIEAIMLALAIAPLTRGDGWGALLACTASGLQNALATQYSRAIVRTTHVTGIVTDLGIALGAWAARRGINGWRVGLHLALLLGFVAGACLGAVAFAARGTPALALPAAALGTFGVAYSLIRHRARHLSAAADPR